MPAKTISTTQKVNADNSRLVIITPGFWPSTGGVETHVTATTRQLVAAGYDVTIVTADRTHTQPSQWWWQPTPDTHVPVQTLRIPALKYIGLLALWWQMLRLLPLFLRADVIHIHDVAWWFWPIRLLLPTAKVVVTMHGWEGVFPIPTKLKLLKQLSATVADRILVIGDFICWHYGIHPEAVSYGAVDIETVLRQLSEVTNVNDSSHRTKQPGVLTIAYVGRLDQDTGLPLLLAAAQDVSLHKIKWVFYGDGPLRQVCEQLGEVHGFVTKREWLSADIIVASGYLTVWEALAARKQVVVIAQHQLRRDYFAAAPFAAYIHIGESIADVRAIVSGLLAASPKTTFSAAGQQLALHQTWSHLTQVYTDWYQQLQTDSVLASIRTRFGHVSWSQWHARLITKFLVGVYAACFGLAVLGVVLGGFVLSRTLSAQRWEVVGRTVPVIRVSLDVLYALTGSFSSTLQASSQAAQALEASTTALMAVQTMAEEVEKPQPVVYQRFVDSVVKIVKSGGAAEQAACRSWVGPRIIPELRDVCGFFALQPTTLWVDAAQLAQYLLTDERTLIVVLQNSQELRATGGFMGSYVRIELSGQKLPTFEVGDIYEPDGQFQGMIPAPAGVAEYLSSGKGLRLPDANWQPDFPTSAQTILQYFAFGRKHGVDGVVALNLSVMQSVLEVVGPIELPDYSVEVTAENLPDVARADRSAFFPGSQQKTHFLSALAKQLQFKLTTLNRHQWQQLAKIIWTGLARKEIQAYMIDEDQQQALDRLGWSGRQTNAIDAQTVPSQPTSQPPLYFMAVESNVGINKANRAINRQLLLDLYPTELLIKLTIENQNQFVLAPTEIEAVNGMGYVNYQRLYVPAYLTVRTIEIAGQKLPSWHEQLIQTDSGETFNQIGFIMTIPQQTGKSALITLQLNDDEKGPRDLTTLPGLRIQRQSGLPPTAYTIQTPKFVKQILLTDDQFLPLSYNNGQDVLDH